MTVHCQWEDETVRKRTGYPPSYAEAKKMKSLTLNAHGPLGLEPCAGRAATADNLWAPPPTFVDLRAAAAADNLLARRRSHCCNVAVYLFSCNFQWLKKGRQKILRIERNFWNLWKNIFGRQCRAAADCLGPAARRHRPKLTGAPLPTQWRLCTALLRTSLRDWSSSSNLASYLPKRIQYQNELTKPCYSCNHY